MEIVFNLKISTEMKSGGALETITMFTRTIVLTSFTGKQLINWVEDGYIQIDDWNFRPKDLTVINNSECICTCSADGYVLHRDDSKEYYESLVSKGWMPCIEHAQEIRSRGYPNFDF